MSWEAVEALESGLPGAIRFSLEQVRDDPEGCVAQVWARVQWRGGVLAPGERS